VRKAVARQHVTHAMDGFGIAYEIGEGHGRNAFGYWLLAVRSRPCQLVDVLGR
jgi:hypothetical protein